MRFHEQTHNNKTICYCKLNIKTNHIGVIRNLQIGNNS
jgi:hypothetical protein